MPDEKPDSSIRASLERGFADAEKASAEPEAPATDTPASEPVEVATADETRDAGQPRDEHGRFAPKAASEETETPAAAAPEEATSPAEAPQPAPAHEPPTSWKAEDRAHWAKIPTEVQATIARREAERDRYLTEQGQRIAPLSQAVEQWQPYLASLGVSPEYAFHTLINADRTLRHGSPDQKRQALATIAQQYGISLGQQQAAPAGQADEFVDPQVARLAEENARIRSYLSSREQAEHASRYRSTIEQIEAFAAEKDASGSPAHAHFDAVKDAMARLALVHQQQGKTPSLKALYDEAVWLDPTVRSSLISAQQKAAADKVRADAAAHAAKAEAEKKAKAAAARNAAVSVSGSPTNGSIKAPERSIRESLEANWRTTQSRL